MSRTSAVGKTAAGAAFVGAAATLGVSESVAVPLTIVFAVLKATALFDTNVVDWSWWAVFAPILVGVGLGSALLIVSLLLLFASIFRDL